MKRRVFTVIFELNVRIQKYEHLINTKLDFVFSGHIYIITMLSILLFSGIIFKPHTIFSQYWTKFGNEQNELTNLFSINSLRKLTKIFSKYMW